ncbi:MAG TPA: STAS domain-containing protein [Nevskiaceae bacterium]|nr:STAS domain-containing protein [Nevskiaceae bacterium]
MSPLAGDLTFPRMREWLERADELAAAGQLDLGRVEHADSAGVAFLLELTRRARSSGRDLVLANVGQDLRGLLEFLQVDDVLKLQG